MAYKTSSITNGEISGEYVQWLIEHQWPSRLSRFEQLWDYYDNRPESVFDKPAELSKANEMSRTFVLPQEAGLPPRITGVTKTGPNISNPLTEIQRKEVVIENDIGWRINAMVDYLFGSGIKLLSKAEDAGRKSRIENILNAVFEHNGAASLFQEMAVLGSVYGYVDCLIRCGGLFEPFRISQLKHSTSANPNTGQSLTSQHFTSAPDVEQLAREITIELIEAPRSLPVLDENDYRSYRLYVQHFIRSNNALETNESFLTRILRKEQPALPRSQTSVTEVFSQSGWQRYEDGELVMRGENPLGVIPVVHIQNMARPCFYEGHSDVEPLIPLQDELNTRLSDRANRITFQSFRMFLLKGIDAGTEKQMMPGRLWSTFNENASIDEFGGDANCPSETEHIGEIREALDKVSGVTPIVAGVIRDKLGNLTSAVALRMTLMGMLAKTQRKRLTYGEGIRRICRLILLAFDKSGIFHTEPREREIEIIFPNPQPEDTIEKLREAQLKQELGISREQVLKELGYSVEGE
ncbi:Phage portal protein, SPP1 Gp6-like [Limihaloglobus sulfuriphilus]|uniref:Phage portal protein, SPP1 Gp6-like n=1 Tax=Limihaloglobus sulfuriphilus TaxID=1851148 RepID=A0A1Q2MHE8_9BACT|nr:phage portal protein [Limihaloglobus sulfuriphilus]AQQ72084.1 Phage portal protein, SPP1 Gp6-like [Limihaloglobus sulfuriphilus]